MSETIHVLLHYLLAVRSPGRLELTWANKDMRLLAHDDVSYEWVDPADWRVSEVRLLERVGEVGEPDSGNLLIRGDALHALTALAALPDLAAQYLGKVKLCYIDPPFNTGQTFQHYDDALEHSVWLTMLRDRLMQIKKLLSPDGSVWVHLDDVEAHRARCILDEVFGAENFVATVIWEKTDSPRMDAKQFSSAHDTILVYSKTAGIRLNRHEVIGNPSDYPHVHEDGRTYSRRELRKWGNNSLRTDRPTLWYPIEAPDGSVIYPIRPDGREGNWRWQKSMFLTNLDRIDWVERGGHLEPYVITFSDATKRPRPSKTLWRVEEFGGNPVARNELKALFPDIEPFATPKPEALISEVIFLGTDPGDIVLDCFAGSATTAAVAHKMGRRWVTSELSQSNLDTFARPRLEKVVAGEDPGGITEAVEWKGGGGFSIAEVAPSMFELVDDMVVLSEWATGGELAEAVCAQVRYVYEPSSPFAGRKGRSRLAVVDGMLTTGVVDFLVGRLDDSQTLLAYAQALEPGIEEYVRAARSGSRAKKVPRNLARSGVLESRLVHLGETTS